MNYDNLSMEEFESLYDETDKSIAVLESYLSITTLEPSAANVAIESLSNIYGSDVSGNYNSVIVNGNVSLEGLVQRY